MYTLGVNHFTGISLVSDTSNGYTCPSDAPLY